MIVDCMACPVRGQQCDDCAVTVLGASGLSEHLVGRERPASPQHLLSSPFPSTDLALDAAEKRVVSMFVGAGLVSAGAVGTLCARRESVLPWATARDVG